MGDWIVKNIPASSIFVLAGLFMMGWGFYIWWSQQRCIEQTTGVVKTVDHEVKDLEDNYRALFAYSVEGVEYVRSSSHVYSKPKFSAGDSVTIFYDPSKPQRFYVLEEGKQTSKAVFFLVGFGVVILLITIFTESK